MDIIFYLIIFLCIFGLFFSIKYIIKESKEGNNFIDILYGPKEYRRKKNII